MLKKVDSLKSKSITKKIQYPAVQVESWRKISDWILPVRPILTLALSTSFEPQIFLGLQFKGCLTILPSESLDPSFSRGV